MIYILTAFQQMKYFCTNCNNLLVVNTTNDKLSFKCINCHFITSADADDSLRYEEIKNGNLVIYKTLLNCAKKDPLNIKEKKTCPKCKHHISKNVRIGLELRLISVCEKCGFQRININ